MRNAIIIAILGAIIGVILTLGYTEVNVSHSCTAPCVVSFNVDDMYEDMFDFDYRGNGTVRVWQVNP
jgi:hypothetical protein